MRTLPVALALVVLVGCKKDEAPTPPPVAAKPAPAPAPPPEKPSAAKPTDGKIELAVTDDGFVPANVVVKVGEPVTLVVTRKTDETCATEILIEDTDIKVDLPLNKAVEVTWTPTKTGKVKFGCAMDKMIGGLLLVE